MNTWWVSNKVLILVIASIGVGLFLDHSCRGKWMEGRPRFWSILLLLASYLLLIPGLSNWAQLNLCVFFDCIMLSGKIGFGHDFTNLGVALRWGFLSDLAWKKMLVHPFQDKSLWLRHPKCEKSLRSTRVVNSRSDQNLGDVFLTLFAISILNLIGGFGGQYAISPFSLANNSSNNTPLL